MCFCNDYLLICLTTAGQVANNADPDQMLHSVVSNLGLSVPIGRRIMVTENKVCDIFVFFVSYLISYLIFYMF